MYVLINSFHSKMSTLMNEKCLIYPVYNLKMFIDLNYFVSDMIAPIMMTCNA